MLARTMPRAMTRVGSTVCLVATLALASASTAAASTTIGQLAPSPVTAVCNNGPDDVLSPTVTSGTSYVVPSGGVSITSWSTNVPGGLGQQLTFKVYRKVSDPATYKVVAHNGPQNLNSGTVNTFPVNIAVQPGDVIGLNDANASTVNNACIFSAPGDSYLDGLLGSNTPDGGTHAFTPVPNSRVNVQAHVAFKASNADTLGALKRNKHKGTATLSVNVPGPGTLALTGKGVKTQRPAARAAASKVVSAAGTVKLLIKAKGKAKKKLNTTGKVKVKVTVTYTPNGSASGDVPGDPNTQTKRVKLVKKLG
jgi:hypothetical protein